MVPHFFLTVINPLLDIQETFLFYSSDWSTYNKGGIDYLTCVICNRTTKVNHIIDSAVLYVKHSGGSFYSSFLRSLCDHKPQMVLTDCKYCHGTRKIELFTSIVDCECALAGTKEVSVSEQRTTRI